MNALKKLPRWIVLVGVILLAIITAGAIYFLFFGSSEAEKPEEVLSLPTVTTQTITSTTTVGEAIAVSIAPISCQFASQQSGMAQRVGQATVLVNAQHPLPSGYVPNSLSPVEHQLIEEVVGDQQVANEALPDLQSMADAYGAAYPNTGGLPVRTIYRSEGHQQSLFDNDLNCLVAPPRGSCHQTGYCIDFTSYSFEGVLDCAGFQTTQEGQWLSQHGWKYGFVPEFDEPALSCVYRWVGSEHAGQIHEQGLGLQTYLQSLE